MPRVVRGHDTALALTCRFGIDRAFHTIAHIDLADTAVTVDAWADLLSLPGAKFVRQIRVGKNLAAHTEKIEIRL